LLSYPTDDLGRQLFASTSDVTAEPKVCAHLVYSFSGALRQAVQEPDVSAAYYEGFTFSEKAAVEVPKVGLKYESGYTWSPVPMLKALSVKKELELTQFYSDFKQRLMYKASSEWSPEKEYEFDRELQKWINLEAGKFCPETKYEYSREGSK
jgi:hypothetical protein